MLKLKIFFAWLTATAYSLIRGKATKPVVPPKKFLVVQLAKLGDMVCATPLPAALKAAYPACQVTVIGTRPNEALLAYNPDVDRYVPYNKNFFAIVRQIRRERYDGACLLIPNFIGLLFLYLGGIRAIAAPIVVQGWSPYQTWQYRSLLRCVLRVPHQMGHYAPREYLRLLEPWGIKSDTTTKHLGFSPAARDRAATLLQGNGITAGQRLVGMSPSAGNKIKCWSPRRFAAVADYVAAKYAATVVIIGTKSDEEPAREMIDALGPSTPHISTVGLLSIDELKALVARLDLFISVDSGPIYIAEAFGVPTIDIVGPMDEREQPPRGDRHRIVKIDRSEPVLHIMNARVYDHQEARRQIEAITPEMVYPEIDALLG